MSIGYVECAHCGETVGTYYVTCPLLRVQARQAGTVLPALPRLGREPARKGD
nr:MAG TPA: zinc finger domain protein [Caudoviricetes sp.]